MSKKRNILKGYASIVSETLRDMTFGEAAELIKETVAENFRHESSKTEEESSQSPSGNQKYLVRIDGNRLRIRAASEDGNSNRNMDVSFPSMKTAPERLLQLMEVDPDLVLMVSQKQLDEIIEVYGNV